MLQAKLLATVAVLSTAGWMAGTAAQAETPEAIAADPLPEAPAALTGTPATGESTLPTADPAADEAAEVTQAEPLTCPPGQFPSAFADVYPWEWAYQAVNNLASPSMTCFDLPENRP